MIHHAGCRLSATRSGDWFVATLLIVGHRSCNIGWFDTRLEAEQAVDHAYYYLRTGLRTPQADHPYSERLHKALRHLDHMTQTQKPRNWIPTREQLPPENQYVFVHLSTDDWNDLDDPAGPYFQAAKFVRQSGVSKWVGCYHPYSIRDVDYWMTIPPLAPVTGSPIP